MKTIKELSVEHGIDRSTLLKAAGRSRKRDGVHAWAYQSGDIWLIDEESERFKVWLAGSKLGRPRKSQASPS